MTVDNEPQTLIVDLMAGDLVVVAPNLPVDVVAPVPADHDIGGLPVVDGAGRLVGASARPTSYASGHPLSRGPPGRSSRCEM